VIKDALRQSFMYKTFKRKFPEFIKEYEKLSNFLPSSAPYRLKKYCILNKINEIPKCPICNNEIPISHNGFTKTCSKECKQKQTENTLLAKYGATSTFKVKSIVEKGKKTMLKKYGVDNFFRLTDVLGDIKEAKYGNRFYSNNKKAKQTKLEKYGDEHYNNRDKAKETCIEKYKVSHHTKSKKYTEKWYNNKEWLEHKNSSRHQSMKLNGSYNVSKKEEQVYVILCDIFGKSDILREYKSEKYPFSCDFYIKSLDLYIEYNGHWTHGKEPYDLNNKDHQLIVEKWKDENSDFYKTAIDIWTVRDLEKRQIAKENNLNYVILYSKDFNNIHSIINNHIRNRKSNGKTKR